MTHHIIVSGDTLWALGQHYHCSVNDLINENPGINPNNLTIGSSLRIPGQNHQPISNVRISDRNPQARSDVRYNLYLNPDAPSPINQLRRCIDPAAKETDVPADLIGAVIYQESGGNIDVNSTTNPGGMGIDSGLMQVNEHVAEELEKKYPGRFRSLSGEEKQTMLGASYLKEMYETVADRDWPTVLRAYNSGPNGINKNNLRDLPARTGDSTYVDKVLHFWSDISQGRPLPTDHYESIYKRGF